MRFVAIAFGLIMFFGGFALLGGGSGKTNSTDAMNFVLGAVLDNTLYLYYIVYRY